MSYKTMKWIMVIMVGLAVMSIFTAITAMYDKVADSKVPAYADYTWEQVEDFNEEGLYSDYEYGIFYDPTDGLWDIVVF